MQATQDQIMLSAGDLSNHSACRYLTYLNLSAAFGHLSVPTYRDPNFTILQERGLEFENAYLQKLKEDGKKVEILSGVGLGNITETFEAIKTGIDIIYQAVLKSGRWQGRADFLERIDISSSLGNWSYEVTDSKLAKETRAGTILQLSLYSELLATLQGTMPASVYVITPEDGFKKQHYHLHDYLAYYRLVKRKLEAAVDTYQPNAEPCYPVPVPHCEICRWWQHCDTRRRQDDHLSFVAGLSNTHSKEMEGWPVRTLSELAQKSLPLPKPNRGASETYLRLREQARVQFQARERKQDVYELLPVEQGQGLSLLPIPSPGDVFFDFEGDPFVGTQGLEYLFGYIFNYHTEQYHALWAFSPEEEKAAYEDFIDQLMDTWRQYPDFHIYHYTAYEPGALKRLMGRYGSKAEELDQLLRAGRFVDLYTITRHSIRAGIETYSLKELERFHEFNRKLELRDAARQKRVLEGLLERNNATIIPAEIIKDVAQYNQEDCLSTHSLRNWLEQLRNEYIRQGAVIPRPEAKIGDASDAVQAHLDHIKPIFEALMAGISEDPTQRSISQQAKWLIAHMLDWYSREKKSFWWEYFRLLSLNPEDLYDEKSALTGLQFTGSSTPIKKSTLDTYTYPLQECDLRVGDKLKTPAGRFGEIISIDNKARIVTIKKGPNLAGQHPTFVFKHEEINDEQKEKSIIRLAQWVVDNDIDAPGVYRAARDLLLHQPPRLHPGVSVSDKANPQEKAYSWVQHLDQGVLAIQGPPGAGKSHTAAHMILNLVQSGKKVGITAMSHKVIVGLLSKVQWAANEHGLNLQCGWKSSTANDDAGEGIIVFKENGQVASALQQGQIQVAGGTAWLWSREEMAGSIDYLFVDEAGQLSLIDTLAVAQAAENLILLGDPQQLKQPIQGNHPEGTAVSALEHVLTDPQTQLIGQTIHAETGIFLDQTWRLHPSICLFVSEMFYEGRLKSKDDLIMQQLTGPTKFAGAGLWFESVIHNSNQNNSIEEAHHIFQIVEELTSGTTYYTDRHQKTRPLSHSDILVIAPYNAQVTLLSSLLPAEVAVGTVDKFQGQEAAVVILSLATSSPEEAPRGMEFLYSLNRLNVATSRAKATFILVGNPLLFEPDCKSIPQMKLANAFCRYLEMQVH